MHARKKDDRVSVGAGGGSLHYEKHASLVCVFNIPLTFSHLTHIFSSSLLTDLINLKVYCVTDKI